MPQLPIQANGDNYEPMDLDIADNQSSPADDGIELPILDNVNLDLENYVSHYRGLPLIQRLEFIADHCNSLRIEALLMAIQYIKANTYNVKDYQRLCNKLINAGYRDIQIDTDWIDTKTKQAGLRFERLDNDLKNFRQHSMKENIRRGQDDLGEHYLDCGELENAFIAYNKSRDYILNNKNQINQCLNMIRVSVILKRWPCVSNHVLRAESQPTSDNTMLPATSTKLHCAAGLFELNSRKYKKAAKHFLSTNIDHFNRRPATTNRVDRQAARRSPASSPGPSSMNPSSSSSSSTPAWCVNSKNTNEQVSGIMGYWEILAPINIAVYGSLCALASYSRQELAQYLINSATFKQFAELDPQTREAVHCFHDSKYAQCLSILQDIKNTLLLDMYLAPHVERLYRDIRNRALVQYFEPYSTASMFKMAEAFNTTVAELEREIITLIYEGQVKARIDSHNKILYSKNMDPRTITFERAIKMGKLWQRQTRALISRQVILNAGLFVTNSTLPDRIS